MPPTLLVRLALEPTPVGGPEHFQSVSMWSVKDSWFAITSRKAKTSARRWGTSTDTVTGAGMYRMVHYACVPWQRPRAAARRRDRAHRRARDLRPQPARARGRDRDQ